MNDKFNHPSHYRGVTIEPIQICRVYGFELGNAIKYLARAGKKAGCPAIDDLKKALVYLRWVSEHNNKDIYPAIGIEEFRLLDCRIRILFDGNPIAEELFGIRTTVQNPTIWCGIVSLNCVDNAIELLERTIEEVEK